MLANFEIIIAFVNDTNLNSINILIIKILQ